MAQCIDKDGESYTLNNLYYNTSHDNSDSNRLTHVKVILSCSCLVAQCIDKDGASYILNNLYYYTSHDNSDCNWLTHVKDILTCSCLVAQCFDKDGRAATFTRVNGTVSCFCNKRLQN